TGLDIGSSKVSTIIAQVEEDQIQIIGEHSVPSKGVKKGVIVDIDEAVEAIERSLEGAERMAGIAVSEALVLVDGQHISSVNSQGVVAVSSPEGEITHQDVDRVIEAARAISIPGSREIVDVITRSFTVDSQIGVQDPIGMSGVRLQVDTHIVHGAVTSMRNLVKCVHQVGVDVAGLVFEGFAAAEAVLTPTERELGVALIDIGGGTTDITLIVEGSPAYSTVLPIGGKNMTNDLAIGLRVGLEDAEKIKVFVSDYNPPAVAGQKKSDEDEIDVSELNIEGMQKIDKKFVRDGILRPRLEEIFEQVDNEIQKSGYADAMPAGVVVTGGSASTIGLTEVARRTMRGIDVRVGQPKGVSGLIDEVSTPAYAATIGNIIYGSRTTQVRNTRSSSMLNKFGGAKSLVDKVVSLGKSFLP
ncbi:cell division protein FtsA, partial [candidate division WWE3 bacterium]|nr:cell division protein FtsA [candidate division WWE3 bacterium]